MKKIVLLFLFACISMIYVGCETDSSKNEEYADVKADDFVLKGTLKYRIVKVSGFEIKDWDFGPSEIKMIAGNDDVLVKGVVKADGNFEMLIPGTIAGKYLFGLNSIKLAQGGTIFSEPETVRVFNGYFFKVKYFDGTDTAYMYPHLHSFTNDLIPDKSYSLHFFDREGKLYGKGKNGNTFDWSFSKGWQWIQTATIGASTTMFESNSVQLVPTNAFWTN